MKPMKEETLIFWILVLIVVLLVLSTSRLDAADTIRGFTKARDAVFCTFYESGPLLEFCVVISVKERA